MRNASLKQPMYNKECYVIFLSYEKIKALLNMQGICVVLWLCVEISTKLEENR